MQVIAIDWSGNANCRDQREHIWVTTVQEGQLTSLSNGRTRQETIDHLKCMADLDTQFVVGLDFAFSLPAWFLQARGLPSAHDLWSLAGSEGEQWLEHCKPPFWGRPGKTKPVLVAHFRETELTCGQFQGIGAKSVFQIGGGGAVGTGSIRGMPFLRDVHDAGFSIWPFDPPGWPRVIEIYPRALTGSVVKSDHAARKEYLTHWSLPLDSRTLAEGSEDAFDAAVSALVMSRHVQELRHLKQTTDPVVALEGEIWVPHDVAPDVGDPTTCTDLQVQPDLLHRCPTTTGCR